jgi:twitching motility protein PilI
MNDKVKSLRHWLTPSAALNRFKPPPGVAIGIAPVERRRVRYGFKIGNLGLLINQDTVSEVLEQTPVYPLPNTPIWLAGLVNLRGNLVPVFDVRQLLELGDADSGVKRRLLILDQAERAVGLLIDNLPQVATFGLPLNRLPPLPATLRPHVSKAYTQEDMVWLEFNHQSFFQSLAGPIAGAA